MATSADVYGAVKTYLTANWLTTTIAWENEQFTPPEPPAAWIAVEVTGNLLSQASLGAGADGNLWREGGMVWLHVFVPAFTGSETARTYARNLVGLFRGLALNADTIRFRDASIGLGQAGSDDGLWWRLSASVEWQSDS